MSDQNKVNCPECDDLDRRDFIRVVGSSAALLTVGGAATVPAALAANAPAPEKAAKPAEALIKELHSTLTPEQKEKLVLPFDHKDGGSLTRLGMYNRPIMNLKVGDNYTKPQQELVDRILRAITSGEEGYRQITRNGGFDGSGSLQGCGALLFGDPTQGEYAWVFSSHHLTIRCDGNTTDGVAFGGPLYYGHSIMGYNPRNVYNYQTKSVESVFEALNEGQRKKAVVTGNPGERESSIRFRNDGHPGIAYSELDKGQKELVANVMRTVLAPYRKEEGDEVMAILKANGGLEKIHLAFYQDKGDNDAARWHFWRLEGPGFVWNYRVLPHVHCYVAIANAAKKA